ncbi:beta family protein [Kribbella lupini]|uniref:T4 beta protein n=1 Tax=Kribbella lupini TaxID=291602 RepID=A0ABN2AMP3_9ACTN
MAPAGTFRTLVTLRAKAGELAALGRAQELSRVQPLLSLDHDGTASTEYLLHRAVATARHLHTIGCLVMLDAAGLSNAPEITGGAAGALGELADRLSFPADLFQSPVPFVPVVHLDAPDGQLAQIARLADELGAGYAVRVTTPDRHSFAEQLPRLRGTPADIDLILDLAYVSNADNRLADLASELLDVARSQATFRSMTLLSGSIPKALAQTDQWEQPRYEELLWGAVARAGLSEVRLGDYGVVHPVVEPGLRRSKHLSVKYTCGGHWLYLRERMLEPDEESSRARTLRVVSRHLVSSSSFAGPHYSWGDQQFVEAATNGGSGLGSTSKPVAFATSHHLSYLANWAA